MKICLISSLYSVSGGGAGVAVQQLAEGLSARHWEVTLITLRGNIPENEIFLKGIRIISLPSFNFYPLKDKDNHSAWQKVIWQLVDIFNPLMLFALYFYLRKENPDIVHVHKMRGFSAVVWLASHWACPGKVIQTCHDYESISPIGTLDGQIGKWARSGYWLLKPYQSLRRFFSKNVAFVTCPSKFTLDIIISKGVFPLANRIIIHNSHGFAANELKKNRLTTLPERRDEVVHFLYLGRLEPEKGVVELCSAFSKLKEKNNKVELFLAGWGSLETELRNRYEGKPGFKFFSRLIGNPKYELISRSNILVVPSTYLEISPLTVIEAYACGKPVIAANVGGLVELVDSGVTGLLFDPNAPTALLAALEKCVNESLLFQPAKCFDKAEEFEYEKILDQYETVYFHMMETSRDS